MDIKDLQTKIDEPYPEVKDLKGNSNDIRLLAKAYSSCGSETTAVLQYAFQHYMLPGEIGDIIGKISLTEMIHHELLGKAIVAMGGVPYLTNGFGGDYTTKCVYEGRDIKDMLTQNIKDEKAAVEYYESIKDKLSNSRLTKLIERIMADELVHIDVFNKLMDYVSFYKDN